MSKKVIELFAGCGGLALGLELAGFETIALNEIDVDAANTLKTNRPNWNVIQEDIQILSQQDLEKTFSIKKYELDLLSGGFPCQTFSYAGNRKGFEDTRGTLFSHYAIVLKKLMPKMFLAENVKGLISHDKGNTLEIILNTFKEVGYQVQYKVLNAWDYDTPQKRERIFIVGIRNDLASKIYYEFPKTTGLRPVLSDVLYNVPPSPGILYSESKKKVMDLVPPGGCWVDLPEDIAKEYMKTTYYMGGGRRGIARRLSMDEPSLTLTTSPAMKQTERCHPFETRPLNIREYARIQTFPDNWVFCGKITSQYRQIGNAVPVNLAKHVGISIINSLKKGDNNE
jgi:DNA (cytosine-5)-methyltransferase 1